MGHTYKLSLTPCINFDARRGVLLDPEAVVALTLQDDDVLLIEDRATGRRRREMVERLSLYAHLVYLAGTPHLPIALLSGALAQREACPTADAWWSVESRDTSGIPCHCGGYCGRVDSTEEECAAHGCGRDRPGFECCSATFECCSATFVCYVCGKRHALSLPAPDTD